jgi:hypothetical protein
MSWWQWRIDVGALMDTAASFFNLIDFAACLHAEVIRQAEHSSLAWLFFYTSISIQMV